MYLPENNLKRSLFEHYEYPMSGDIDEIVAYLEVKILIQHVLIKKIDKQTSFVSDSQILHT